MFSFAEIAMAFLRFATGTWDYFAGVWAPES